MRRCFISELVAQIRPGGSFGRIGPQLPLRDTKTESAATMQAERAIPANTTWEVYSSEAASEAQLLWITQLLAGGQRTEDGL